MRKLLILLGVFMLSGAVFGQSKPKEIASFEVREKAEPGTFQFVFKNEASKEYFKNLDWTVVSDLIKFKDIKSFDDLLIIIHENRNETEELIWDLGDYGFLYIPSLKAIKSSDFTNLKREIVK
jgi:hypothetical protein